MARQGCYRVQGQGSQDRVPKTSFPTRQATHFALPDSLCHEALCLMPMGWRSIGVVIDLEVRLVDRFDHEFRDVDASWKGGDRDDDLADVGGSQDLFALLGSDGDGSLFEDRGVDFTGVDVGDTNAFRAHFVGHTGTEGGHGEFAGSVSHAPQGDSSLSGDARDVDDEA